MRSGRRTVLGAFLLSAALAVTGCSSSAQGTPNAAGEAPKEGETAPKAKIVADPAVDAKDVEVLKPITISVTEGTLTEAALTNPEGKPVKGEIAADKLSWTASERLGYGKTYTYAAKARGSDEKDVELVDFGGQRIMHGFAGLVEGPLDDGAVRGRAMKALHSFLNPADD